MQVSVLDEAKQAHSNAQWWIKVDGCDLVEALGESVYHVWSGDEDLNNGEVAMQHTQYMQRLEHISSLCRNLTIAADRSKTVNDLVLHKVLIEQDIAFIVKSEVPSYTVLYTLHSQLFI